MKRRKKKEKKSTSISQNLTKKLKKISEVRKIDHFIYWFKSFRRERKRGEEAS